MPANPARQIAEELLANNPVLLNKVRIICRNDLAPGREIIAAAFEAVPRIPKAEIWSVVRTIEEYDLLDMYKDPVGPIILPHASGGQIVAVLLGVAIIKQMKQLVLESAAL